MVIAPQAASAQVSSVPKTSDHHIPAHLAAEMKPERIGYRLRLLREALGYKPSEISDALDIERTYWSRFERGNRALSEGVAVLLVDRFGVTLDFLMLGRWDKLPLDLASKLRETEARIRAEESEPK